MEVLNRAAGLLIPSICPVCRRRAEADPVCRECLSELRKARSSWSGRVGPIEWVVSAFPHEGIPRKALAAFKFGGRPGLAPLLASSMAGALRDLPLAATIVPVASHPLRVGLRGFDSTALLASCLAREVPDLGLAVGVLRRRDLGGQRGRTRAERLARPPRFSSGAVSGDILLVDDVLTTGSTLRTAARVLSESGSVRIRAVTFTRES